MIQVRHLTKRYGSATVLADLSFAVPAGHTLALWGHNGAGKSTTLRCLLGQVRFAGEVWVAGIDAASQPLAVRQLVGYVPQEFPVFDLTAAEAVAFFAALRGVDPRRGADLLAQVGLEDAAGKPVAALSGGMRQRLALALALLADPPVLLLDEPAASLDVAAARELSGHLVRLKRAGKTLVVATHRPEEVRALADSVLVLDGGRATARWTNREFARQTMPAVEEGAPWATVQ